jgi:hypothetical protein
MIRWQTVSRNPHHRLTFDRNSLYGYTDIKKKDGTKMIDLSKLQDKQVQCVDCENFFTWTASEQAFYASKGLLPVKRCRPCLQARKATLIKGVRYDS